MGSGATSRGFAAAAVAVAAVISASTPANADQTAIGSYIPAFSNSYPPRPKAIDRQTRAVGHQPLIVSAYRQWRQPLVERSLADPVWVRGSVLMLTWEPFNYSGGRFRLRDIVRGKYDRYLRRSARSAAAYGHPILVRFAHEMNGDWYPWGVGARGNSAALYKRAWRHVVGLFRHEGARNVQWVWAPQVNKDGRYPFRRLFPGTNWVDWVGLDGFNAGVHGNWNSFTEIFGSSYNEIVRMTPRPILVTETGSTEQGGNKAEWVTSVFEREISNFPRLRAVVWFNAPFNGLDFRINSSGEALSAFKNGVAASRYDMSRAEFLGTPKYDQDTSPAAAAPSGGYGRPSLWYRLTQKLHGPYIWFAIGASLAFLVLVAFAISRVRRSLRPAVTSPLSNTRP